MLMDMQFSSNSLCIYTINCKRGRGDHSPYSQQVHGKNLLSCAIYGVESY
jgi:hypothetical protein